MDEECDFDTLAALLDDDDIKESSSEAFSDQAVPQTRTINNVKDMPIADESSDDDIDEDELDKLAALVEENEAPEIDNSEPSQQAVLMSEDKTIKQSDQPSLKQTHTRDEIVSTAKVSDTESRPWTEMASASKDTLTDKDIPKSESDSGEESDEDAALKEQLFQMQQQMALLASRLENKNKKKKHSSPKPSRSSAESSGDTPERKKTKSVKSAESGLSRKNAKEFNIFDIIDGKNTSSEGRSEHIKKSDTIKQNSAENSDMAPWERKKSIPTTGYKLSTACPRQQPSSRADKELEAKLSSTIEKITEQQKSKAQEKPKTERTNFYGSKSADEELEQKLFGSDSDSDWSDLDGEKQSNLSKEGKEMVKALKKRRLAHEPKYDASDLEKYRDKPKIARSWNTSVYGDAVKNGLAPSSSKAPTAESEDKDVTRDPFSGIRIMKPLVSSSEMKRRMSGRKMIKISQLFAKRNTSAVEGDWVTIGVIAHKGEPRMSQNNKQYSVWKLTDLEDCDQIVHLFLFGEGHKAHWKTIQGSVIGLLNPSIMKSAEKYAAKDQNSVSITIDDKNKLMLMGTSKDLGVCKAKTKSGKPCNNYINKSKHEYCTYHVQAQYKKMSAKRGELSSGFSGVTPKVAEKKLFTNKNAIVTYGGKTYTSASIGSTGGQKKKDQIKVSHLQSHLASGGSKGKVSTLALHNLVPEDKKKLKEYEAKLAEKEKSQVEKNKAFHDMLSVPTVGSMNFVKHLVNKEQIQVESKTKGPVKSITAKELLQMAEKAGKNRATSSNRSAVSGECAPSLTPGLSGPSLGRGFAPGMDIEFDMDAPIPDSRPSKARIQKQLAKKKAIAKVIAGGGVKKVDPNAVKKSDSDVRAKVEKRLAQAAFGGEEHGSRDGPAKKRSRLLGDIDLNDPEVQKLLKKKSRHAAALTEEEQEKQDAYFEVLEKKEAMEDHMAQITKQKCTAVVCHECKYKALSAAERCKKEGHKLTYDKNATKRWFQCKDCKQKLASLNVFPTETCRNCGSSNFERSSMLYEKKGPKLPSEEVLLRGEERKFVNS